MNRLPLGLILRVGALLTGLTGLLMIGGAGVLDDLLDLPFHGLWSAGLVLVAYVGYLLVLTRRAAASVPAAGVRLAIGCNLAWAVGCFGILVAGLTEANTLGIAFILLQVVVVLVFSALQKAALSAGEARRLLAPAS